MYSYLATLRLHATSEIGATLTVGPKRRVVFKERILWYWVTLLSHRSGSLSFGTVLALNNSKIWNVIGGVEYDFA